MLYDDPIERRWNPVPIIVAMMLFLGSASVTTGFLYFSSTAIGSVGDTRISFGVEAGTDRVELARQLKDDGVVRSAAVARGLFAFKGLEPQEGVYRFSPGMSVGDIADILEREPDKVYVTLDNSDIHLERLGWGEDEMDQFVETLSHTVLGRVIDPLVTGVGEELGWNARERDVAYSLVQSDPQKLYRYLPNERYAVTPDGTPGDVAEEVTNELFARYGEEDLVGAVLSNGGAREAIGEWVDENGEYLPDLLLLPPSELTIHKSQGRTQLLFSTTYYNNGHGALELIADSETEDIEGDVERKVFQRVQGIDGEHRDEIVGSFDWHDEHFHYHFNDFIDYRFTPANHGKEDDLVFVEKATYCARDISQVEVESVHLPDDAQYQVCGRNRQGVSVGWGDTYFYDYPGQAIDITGIPSGRYRLSFEIDPSGRFVELNTDNNESSVLIDLDMERGEVKILERFPKSYPEVDHVYPEHSFEKVVVE